MVYNNTLVGGNLTNSKKVTPTTGTKRAGLMVTAAVSAALAGASAPVNAHSSTQWYGEEAVHGLSDNTRNRVNNFSNVASIDNYGNSFSVGIANNGSEKAAASALTLSNGDVAIRLADDLSGSQLHALAAAGFAFKNGYIIAGGSIAREKISYDNVNTSLHGNSVFARLELSNLSPQVRSIVVEVISQQARTREIYDKGHNFLEVEVQNEPTLQREITIQGIETQSATFVGGRETTVRGSVGLNVGENGIAELNISHTRGNIGPEYYRHTNAGIAYTHYAQEQRAKGYISANTDGRIGIGGTKALDSRGKWEAGIDGSINAKTGKDKQVMATIRYNFGEPNTSKSYARPNTSQASMNDYINTINTNSRYAIRDVADHGYFAKASSQTITDVTEKVNYNTVMSMPKFVVNGNTITVTDSGISNFGGIDNIQYNLAGVNNGIVITNTTGKFTELPNGDYIIDITGQKKNGITGQIEQEHNPHGVYAKVYVPPKPTKPVTPTNPVKPVKPTKPVKPVNSVPMTTINPVPSIPSTFQREYSGELYYLVDLPLQPGWKAEVVGFSIPTTAPKGVVIAEIENDNTLYVDVHPGSGTIGDVEVSVQLTDQTGAKKIEKFVFKNIRS